jgi:hypothetical protein
MNEIMLREVKVNDIIYDQPTKQEWQSCLKVVEVTDSEVKLKHVSGERGYSEDENGNIVFSKYIISPFYTK